MPYAALLIDYPSYVLCLATSPRKMKKNKKRGPGIGERGEKGITTPDNHSVEPVVDGPDDGEG